jgi:P-type Mg2+ transporter
MDYRFATLTPDMLERDLATSITTGLPNTQAQKRQQEYGLNQLQEPRAHWFKILLAQFSSPFIYLLFIAAAISFLLDNNRSNAFLIFSLVFINSLLGFIQEYRAEQAVRLLRKHLAITAHVKRNNTLQTIDTKELVPGDIVLLQPGDYVPADIRLIESQGLAIDESALTGESLPAKKNSDTLLHQPHDIYGASNIAFMGTTVTSGSATGIVIATGEYSFFGSITSLTVHTTRESSFELQIKKLSTMIMHIIILTLTILFIFRLIINPGHTDIIQLLLFSIALAIGITPEALPVVTTFALSQGGIKLARNGVIIKRLSAIQDLGSIRILCTDKTGTLTKNKLALTDSYSYNHSNTLLYTLLGAMDSHTRHINPIDDALWKGASEEIIKKAAEYHRIKEIPFDSSLLRNIMLVRHTTNGYTLIARGAFEAVIKHCSPLPEEDLKVLQQWIAQQGFQGHRILATAYKNMDQEPTDLLEQEYDMVFSGFVALEDPIKPSTYQAIEKAHKMGLSIKMLTGDSKEVAYAVAHQIKLITKEEKVITGTEFDMLSLAQKQKAVYQHSIFARVLPKQKYEIVALLKAHDTVGYLGDGINDAPPLKIADVGISVEDAVDIAKDAADIVLVMKSLNVIINGIAQGRIVFANITKYIRTTLSSNFGNFYSLAIASLLIDFLPMLPIQILLVNLLSDFPMISIATDTVDRESLARPSGYNLKDIAFLATLLGLTSSFYDFMFFAIFYKSEPAKLQTIWFIENVLTAIVFIFSIRTRHVFYKAIRPSSLLLSLAFISATISILLPYTHIGQDFFKFIQPSRQDITIIISLVVAYFITTEIVKLMYYHWSSGIPSSPYRKNKHA